jgi:hypothetical protein
MAQWGNKKTSVNVTPTTEVETTEGAPIGVWALVNKGGGPNAHFGNTSGTRARTDLDIYASNTPGQFVKNMAVGIYGTNANDVVQPGTLTDVVYNFLKTGSMYDPDVPPKVNIVMANGFINTTAVRTTVGRDVRMNDTAGHVTGLVKSLPLTGVKADLYIYVDPPPMWAVWANSSCIVKGNSANGWPGGFKFPPGKINDFVDIGSYFTYTCPPGETPIAPLVSGQRYMVATNPYPDGTFPIGPASGIGFITISDFRANITAPAPSHFVQGDTFELGNTVFKPGEEITNSHPGWVVKKEGTGGRAGRVQYECLVAMGTISNT